MATRRRVKSLADWSIREAAAEDADHLALVGAATFLETFAGILDGDAIVEHCRREHGADAYRGYLAQGAWAWIANIAPGRAPIGFALAGSTKLPGSNPVGRDLELKRIYALSRFHGSGLGAELMRKAVERAAAQGAERLLLGVYAGNDRALGFYRRHGFVKIADRRFRVGTREYADVVLAKELR
jgi:ribosomal protein S18 acetylase RimI-like enzyme